MNIVMFDVIGLPRPQGSKRAFVANGRAVIKESAGEHAIWRNQVAAAARTLTDNDDEAPFDGPLALHVEFRFPMPKSRRKAIRDSGRVRKTTAPDLSKLVRSIEDGLQAGGLIADDARICTLSATKVETVSWTGASIVLMREGAES